MFGWSIHWNIWSIQNGRMKTGITHNFFAFLDFLRISTQWHLKKSKSQSFLRKSKMDFFKFVKFSENKKFSLEQWLWETGKKRGIQRKKVLLFFYKWPNIKVKLNRNKSAVMQSYRYKYSQIRCRETEVLPLPLSCRICKIIIIINQ